MRLITRKISARLSTRRRSRFAAPAVLVAALLASGGLYWTLAPAEASRTSNDAATIAKGRALFQVGCSSCHGQNGEGSSVAPPVWGPESFNDGAGMSELDKMAAFVHQVMPKGNPDLTKEQALDAAAYVTSQPRPHFTGK